jgi:hypothetical protein
VSPAKSTGSDGILATRHNDGAQKLDIFKKLHKMNDKQEESQKVFEAFLEMKHQTLLRFYFLSNDDRQDIIGKEKDVK